MSTIEEIQSAIQSLPHGEYMELITWIHKKDWEEWDQQIKEDSDSGALDFLLAEAEVAKKNNTLKEI